MKELIILITEGLNVCNDRHRWFKELSFFKRTPLSEQLMSVNARNVISLSPRNYRKTQPLLA